MKSNPLFLTLAIVLMVSCGSKELTRDKALELLRAEASTLPADDVWVLPIRFITYKDQERRDCPTGYQIAFLNRLVEEGVLSSHTSDAQVPTLTMSTEHPAGTRYEFGIKDPAYVKDGERGAFGTTNASFIMGKQEFKEVTGIKQQEGTAVAEVTVHSKATPLHELLAEVEAQVGLHECSSGFTFPPDRTVSYTFQLYDDGWRLQHPSL